jgi:hypothetical protein
MGLVLVVDRVSECEAACNSILARDTGWKPYCTT